MTFHISNSGFPTVDLAMLFLASTSASSDDGALWTDDRLTPMPTQLQGPFVHTRAGEVLAIDGTSSYVSADGGQTWSDPRPLFLDGMEIEFSRERTLICTESGVIIAAFMNLTERHWTWQNQLHDSPGARLPTCVRRWSLKPRKPPESPTTTRTTSAARRC